MTGYEAGYVPMDEARIDGSQYVGILANGITGALEKYKLNGSQILLQHDDDPKHASNVTENWLKDQELEVMKWPAKSSDVNPFQHF